MIMFSVTCLYLIAWFIRRYFSHQILAPDQSLTTPGAIHLVTGNAPLMGLLEAALGADTDFFGLRTRLGSPHAATGAGIPGQARTAPAAAEAGLVAPRPPATRQIKLWLIQLIVPVRTQDLIDITSHAAHHLNPQYLGVMSQIGTQSATDQGFHTLFPEKFQTPARLQVRDINLLGRTRRRRFLGINPDAGTPIQHRCDPVAQHRYGEHADTESRMRAK
jgi:hypothetical protein